MRKAIKLEEIEPVEIRPGLFVRALAVVDNFSAEASRMIPLVGLYPALAAVLALVFLHESVTPAKIVGILLSVVAIYLLSS